MRRVRGASIRILFLGANPAATTRLNLDVEVREITNRLRATPNAERFEIVQEWAVQVGDLQAAMLRHEPDIVHFSGHGTGAAGVAGADPQRDVEIADAPGPATGGELVIEDDRGEQATVAPEALEALLRIVGGVRCVVLNACYSAVQCDALRRQADCVVGMSDSINDKTSIAFAWAFYQALGFGRSLQAAFDLGKNQIALEKLPGATLPRLVERDGVVAAQVQLLEPQHRRRRAPMLIGVGLIASACAGGFVIAERSCAEKIAPPAKRDGGSLPFPEIHPEAVPKPPAGMAWLAAADVKLGTPTSELESLRARCATIATRQVCENLDEAGYWNNEAPRQAHVDGFFIDQREVTVGEFAGWVQRQPDARVRDDHIEIGGTIVATYSPRPSNRLIVLDGATFRALARYEAFPMVGVTWEGATAACADRGARLPTGAEWERAAHDAGGAGFSFDGDATMCSDAVIARSSGGACHGPGRMEHAGTGTRDRTPEGVVDLLGNVAEWTRDSGDGGSHEIRGGSWESPWLLARPASRLFMTGTSDSVGFRCAAELPRGGE